MTNITATDVNAKWPTLGLLPIPAKTIVTATLIVLAIGMTGALGQIIVHGIIPMFFSAEPSSDHGDMPGSALSQIDDTKERGDLFSELVQSDPSGTHPSLFQTEQFVWLLKWTHIHLFGMNLFMYASKRLGKCGSIRIIVRKAS